MVSHKKPFQLEVCFSPAMLKCYTYNHATVVVIDIFRATSAITCALSHGVSEIIPVATVEEARQYKEMGYLVAAERDGIVLDFADFGNSPFNFMRDDMAGKTIVYSTTNGTQAVQLAMNASQVIIASFINHLSIVNYLSQHHQDVLILCSGWKDRFSFEDSVYAGALCQSLLETGNFITECDSAVAAMELWNLAKNDLMNFKEKFAHRHRLKKLGLDDVIEYCLTFDSADVIPVVKGNSIVKL